jgi:CheY-like chemotaxis protein
MTASNVKSVFGRAVKDKRVEMGISQEELADRAGLHRTYISDVERGVRNVSLESIAKLARALELSLSRLFAQAGHGTGADHLVEILMIEDDPRDAELALRAFQKARIMNVIHIARDGAEAIDFLFATGPHEGRKNQPLPGVILLDLNLPKINGLEVLERIKRDGRLRKIPVVVLTISAQHQDIAECRRLGVDSYIVKPVSFQNFGEVTPYLRLDWALKTPASADSQGIEDHEGKSR